MMICKNVTNIKWMGIIYKFFDSININIIGLQIKYKKKIFGKANFSKRI